MFGITSLPKPVRRALKWDAASAGLGGLSAGAIFPFMGVILRRDLHASAFAIAMLGAAWSVGNLFNPLMAHYNRDRVKLPYAIWPPAISRGLLLLMPLAVAAPAFVAIAVSSFAVGSLASPAYAAVIREHGLAIPDGMSLAGFDDIQIEPDRDPWLTTYAQPKARLGQQAAQLLMRRLERPSRPPVIVMLEGKLVTRGSTAPPRRTTDD